jgi:hypothetical protein
MAYDLEFDTGTIVSKQSTGSQVETALVNSFTRAQAALNELDGKVAENTSFRQSIEDAICVVNVNSNYESPVTQTLNAVDTYETLQCIDVEDVNVGDCFTTDIGNNKIVIKDGNRKYRFFGNLNISAPINDIVTIRLYLDNAETPFFSTAIGRGLDSPVSLSYASLVTTTQDDTDVQLKVKSTGDTVKIDVFNFTIEETLY